MDLGGEPLGRLDTTDVAHIGQDGQRRLRDRGVESVGHCARCSDILIAVQDQRGDVDRGQDVTQIGLGGGSRHRTEPGWVEAARHIGGELGDAVARGVGGEHARQQR